MQSAICNNIVTFQQVFLRFSNNESEQLMNQILKIKK